jgi:hypothetical protein
MMDREYGKYTSAKFIDDILHLILDEICLDDKDALLSMCLVSRRLYLLTAPYLYRNVKLDFTRPSHVHLVRRLVHPGSRWAARIRVLRITGTQKTTALRLLDLYVLFGRITKLQQLEWKGCLSIPHRILETLSVRFPTARLIVEASKTKLGVSTNAPLPFYNIFNHVAGRQLTFLEFKPVNIKQLYNGIKADFLHMLKRAEALQDLRWFEDMHDIKEHPEMLDCFQYGSLPRLRNFFLFSYTMFTNIELRTWGLRGGWSELTNLTLYDSYQLCTFVGQIPKLEELSFFPVENFAIDRIGACLQSPPTDAPFGRLRKFSYKDQDSRYRFHRGSVVVPWCMLERMPKLEHLAFDRCRFIWECPGPSLDMATAQDICRIRTMFPCLKSLSLDLAIRGVIARWPYDLLEELALFKEPIEMNLFLHAIDKKKTRAMLHRFKFSKIFRHIVKLRKAQQLPCQPPFQVGFKVIRLWKQYRNQSDHVDWHLWLDEDGDRNWKRYRTRNDETGEAHGTKTTDKVWQWLGLDQQGYSRHPRQREQSASTTTGIHLDTTLWDAWTS